VTASVFGKLPSEMKTRRAPAAPAERPATGARPCFGEAGAAVATATFSPPANASSAAGAAQTGEHRQESIERSLLGQFMREAQARIALTPLMAVAMGLACASIVPLDQIALWLGVVLTWTIAHVMVGHWYLAHVDGGTPNQRRSFLSKARIFYALIGVIWGCTPILFFDRLGDVREFACWVVLACVLYGPAHRLAMVPAIHRAYTNGLFFTSLSSVVVVTVAENKAVGVVVPMLIVALLQRWATHRIAADVYKTQSALYGVQYDLAAKNEEAEAAVAAKNRFLAAAAHDMRQPVIAMGLYAQFLESDPGSYQELAPKICRASKAVSALFNSLFDLAAFESGRITLAIERISLAEVIRTLQTDFEPHAHARGIELRVRVADAVLQSDATRLRRMIGNALSNAIKYSRPGTRILLAVRSQGPKLRVEVWDQGIGIPASQVGLVFQEFYRAEGGAELAPDGMGLGLSLVTRLATALGATVAIASVEGRGTRVSFTLSDMDLAASQHQSVCAACG